MYNRSAYCRKMVLVLGVVLIATTSGMAGSLEPPAGPVTSTGRFGPRIDVATLPGDGTATRVISQSGSYYMSGNLTGQAGKSGIRFDAGGVTLDLSGYTLTGVPGSLAGLELGGSDVIAISNGMVVSWGGSGIHGSSADSVTIRDVKSFLNAGWGMDLFNCPVVTIIGCTASRNNGPGGISVGDTSLVSQSVAGYNSGEGIHANTASSILDSVVTDNGSSGISCGSECLVRGNTARFNAVNIDAPGSTIIENHQ
jgi:hypothetical protein